MGCSHASSGEGQHGSQRHHLLRPAKAVKKLRKVSSGQKEMLVLIDPHAHERARLMTARSHHSVSHPSEGDTEQAGSLPQRGATAWPVSTGLSLSGLRMSRMTAPTSAGVRIRMATPNVSVRLHQQMSPFSDNRNVAVRQHSKVVIDRRHGSRAQPRAHSFRYRRSPNGCNPALLNH